MAPLTKTQAVATSQEAVQNQNESPPQDESAHNHQSILRVPNPTYPAGLRRDIVQPDMEAERKKRYEIEAGKSYSTRASGGTTSNYIYAQFYASFDKNFFFLKTAAPPNFPPFPLHTALHF